MAANPIFEVRVKIGRQTLAIVTGPARDKKEAEDNALEVLRYIGRMQ